MSSIFCDKLDGECFKGICDNCNAYTGETLTDITNLKKSDLIILLNELIQDTTAPIYSPDNPEKVIARPIYTTGIGLDTESTTITHYDEKTKKTIVDKCFCYTYQISVGEHHYAIYRTPEQLLMFIACLNSLLESRNRKHAEYGEPIPECIIWVANLSHEWSFLKYRLTDDYDISKCLAKSNRDVLNIDFGNFVLRECIGLFGHSLSDIAKNWTVTQKLKGDLDYDLIRTSETPLTDQEKQYCINDVIILSEMHTAVLNAYKQNNGGVVLPNTTSGFVRLKLKESIRNDDDLTAEREQYNFKHPKKQVKTNLQYLCKQNHRLFIDQYQWSICRTYGYCGGLCGSNIDYAGKTQHNVQCVDLTSDYPAQLLHKRYPAGALRKGKMDQWDNILKSNKPYFVLARIKKLDSKSHHATMSKHKVLNMSNDTYIEHYGAVRNLIVYNGKIRRAENLIVLLNDVDIRAYGHIYKQFEMSPIAVYYFDRYEKIPKWLFNSIVSDYVTKAKLKIAGMNDTVEYTDAKRNINTYYGVLATKSSELYDEFLNGIFEPSKEWSYNEMTWNTWLNPYIAFWCTSYAREILMYFIGHFPDAVVQYDTDSLYYIQSKGKQLKQAIDNYNEYITKQNERIFKNNPDRELFLSLGTWDYENLYINFLPMGAKKYIKQDKKHGIQTVVAGLPKTAIPAEIANKDIKKPFEHYNSLQKYICSDGRTPKIVIEHHFANKFASAYNDDTIVSRETITDYLGNTCKQQMGCYHAIVPIDFTLAMKKDYCDQILKIENGTL